VANASSQVIASLLHAPEKRASGFCSNRNGNCSIVYPATSQGEEATKTLNNQGGLNYLEIWRLQSFQEKIRQSMAFRELIANFAK